MTMMTSHEQKTPKETLDFFGTELRKYRQRANFSQDELAAATRFSRSLLGFIERGQRTPSRDLVERCDQVLEAGGELIRLWVHLSGDVNPLWFRGWLGVEQEAHTLHSWQPLVVPGLLQTEDYARAILRGKAGIREHEVEGYVSARMERQAILARDLPPMLWIVLDEGVLDRPVGGHEVMRHQMERLLAAAMSPRIAIQILPKALGVTTGVLGGFVIAQLPGSPDTVYLESALNGQVTNCPEDVEAIRATYDTIRVQAHPRHVSTELIREAEKLWT
ncbi:helix-turn-helix domain-containing protein [Sphaerisporangium rubeum]|uniref:Transcriptional regulator with XRE-family HTH domain n=1 Tax=Sphaerisporangium rubeum TaxID=321317 RepID=A0A7X0IIN6_9ACTN|nr:helix-turn-helix transcriptional regulator [Sphaerisporangium rubeum]MBB6475934.1 transcriptional regulator with XRE-family HTH domain [Sphaerisporangium rubeum]